MADCFLKTVNGRPCFDIGGRIEYPLGYMTYFNENNRYAGFYAAGYRIFFVNAYFTSLPINSGTGFTPCRDKGIFDGEEPFYGGFDGEVEALLAAAPGALIIPRVYIAMPQRWIDSHPDDCVHAKDAFRGGGVVRRESHLSPEYRDEGERLLRKFIAHVRSAPYADRVVGYHLSGGNTQEWMYFDMNGGVCPKTPELFGEYLCSVDPQRAPGPQSVPGDGEFTGEGQITDPAARAYLEFINRGMAATVSRFCRAVKECVDRRQVVGVFYGYVQEQTSSFFGTMGMEWLIDDENVDFFSSPVSYFHTRPLGRDWGEMTCGESVRARGKLYFLENDVRTFLSRYPADSRPGCDPDRRYDSPVWLGPPTEEASGWAMEKSFVRQLACKNGSWWFDMWGGWYDSHKLMDLAARLKALADPARPASGYRPELALVMDESFSRRIRSGDPLIRIQKRVKEELGNAGIPFDAVYSFDADLAASYRAALFPYPESYASPQALAAARLCRQNGAAVLFCDSIPDAASLRSRLVAAGVHCWCDSGDVIYFGDGLLCVHAASPGVKTVRLPAPARVTPAFGGDTVTTSLLTLPMRLHETRTFTVDFV